MEEIPRVHSPYDKSNSSLNMESVSSNPSGNFDVRCLKMALLNSVGISKHYDEVKISMSSQLIDLMAFDETRLDQTITDDQVKIGGYDIVRNDRSRRGGRECRSTILTT